MSQAEISIRIIIFILSTSLFVLSFIFLLKIFIIPLCYDFIFKYFSVLKKKYIRNPFIKHPIPPELTDRMIRAKFSWKLLPDGTWIEACDFCGGNCGQCGTSLGMDVRNQPSMDQMIKNI